MRGVAFGVIGGVMLVLGAASAQSNAAGGGATAAVEDALTPAEQQQFDEAGQDFNAARYAEALAIYKPLRASHPQNARIAKLAAESAINTGDTAYATGILQPLASANPDDWQATALLARVYAQTGDGKDRDAAMTHVAELRQKGLIPAQVQQYLLEKVQAQGKAIWIWHSLVPWGRYQVYDYARIFDESGRLVMRVTLESNDFDQPLFQKEHPKEAAEGKREFSLDGYKDLGGTPGGGHQEEHITFGFLIGQPTYDEVRADFIQIATGTWKPMSNNTHPAAQ